MEKKSNPGTGGTFTQPTTSALTGKPPPQGSTMITRDTIVTITGGKARSYDRSKTGQGTQADAPLRQ